MSATAEARLREFQLLNSEGYHDAFAKILRQEPLTDAELALVDDVRTLHNARLGVSPQDGFPFPFFLDPTLGYKAPSADNPWRRQCR